MAAKKIVPHLWFDKQAKEAAKFYTSLFPDSKITHVTTLRGTPSGDADVVAFELAGPPFMAISAGPLFKFNPSISFILNFDPSRDKNAKKSLDATWKKLSKGGKALMPLDKYPFSQRYGWIEDRYGLSWQLMLTDPKGDPRPFITPHLMFVGENAGKAEAATEFYLDVFPDSKRGQLVRHPKDAPSDKEGTVLFTDFQLEGTWMAATDSGFDHKFQFNEAISFMVKCDEQKEIDYYWDRLSAVKEAQQCGWLKDRYGLSWQITPSDLDTMMSEGTPAQIARVVKAFLPMKKFDLDALRRAYHGEPKTKKASAKKTARRPKKSRRSPPRFKEKKREEKGPR